MVSGARAQKPRSFLPPKGGRLDGGFGSDRVHAQRRSQRSWCPPGLFAGAYPSLGADSDRAPMTIIRMFGVLPRTADPPEKAIIPPASAPARGPRGSI